MENVYIGLTPQAEQGLTSLATTAFREFVEDAAPTAIGYKFEEDRLLREIKSYIDGTYNQHYSQTKFQATEFIVDQQNSVDFLTGNIIKYISRYGKKTGEERKDLLKVIHYAILVMYYDEILKPRAGGLK